MKFGFIIGEIVFGPLSKTETLQEEVKIIFADASW